MAFTYIIKTDTYLRETTVNANVDTQLILPAIKRVQRNIILPILGTALYNDLLTKIGLDADLSGYTDYKILVDDYLTPTMVEFVNAELPPDMTFKFTNKNIVKKNSENSTSIDLQELRNIIQRATYRGQLEGEKVIKYLVANYATKFPLYVTPGNTIDTVFPRQTMFSTGMNLGYERRVGYGYQIDPPYWKF